MSELRRALLDMLAQLKIITKTKYIFILQCAKTCNLEKMKPEGVQNLHHPLCLKLVWQRYLRFSFSTFSSLVLTQFFVDTDALQIIAQCTAQAHPCLLLFHLSFKHFNGPDSRGSVIVTSDMFSLFLLCPFNPFNPFCGILLVKDDKKISLPGRASHDRLWQRNA